MTRAQRIAQLVKRSRFERFSVDENGYLYIAYGDPASPLKCVNMHPDKVPELIEWLRETFVDEEGP